MRNWKWQEARRGEIVRRMAASNRRKEKKKAEGKTKEDGEDAEKSNQ